MDTMFNPAWLVCLDSTHSCDVTVRVLVLLDIRKYRQKDEKSICQNLATSSHQIVFICMYIDIL
jgi:hypothetical protein